MHLAYLLKYRYGFDALAVGHEGNTPETLAHLCQWADMIIIVQAYMQELIPKRFHKKLSLYDIGPDIWKTMNVQMLGLFDGMIQAALGTRKKKRSA